MDPAREVAPRPPAQPPPVQASPRAAAEVTKLRQELLAAGWRGREPTREVGGSTWRPRRETLDTADEVWDHADDDGEVRFKVGINLVRRHRPSIPKVREVVPAAALEDQRRRVGAAAAASGAPDGAAVRASPRRSQSLLLPNLFPRDPPPAPPPDTYRCLPRPRRRRAARRDVIMRRSPKKAKHDSNHFARARVEAEGEQDAPPNLDAMQSHREPNPNEEETRNSESHAKHAPEEDPLPDAVAASINAGQTELSKHRVSSVQAVRGNRFTKEAPQQEKEEQKLVLDEAGARRVRTKAEPIKGEAEVPLVVSSRVRVRHPWKTPKKPTSSRKVTKAARRSLPALAVATALDVPLVDAQQVRDSVDFLTASENLPPIELPEVTRKRNKRAAARALKASAPRSEKLDRFREDLNALHHRLRDGLAGARQAADEMLEEEEMSYMMARLADHHVSLAQYADD